MPTLKDITGVANYSVTSPDARNSVTRGSGVRPVTRVSNAYAFAMKIGGKTVGLIREITEEQRRDVTPVYEVGTVGPVDLIPGQPTFTATGSATKVFGYNLLATIHSLALTEPNLAGAYNIPDLVASGCLFGSGSRGPNDTAELNSLAISMLNCISGYPIPFDIHLVENRPGGPASRMNGGGNDLSRADGPLTTYACHTQTIAYKECYITRYSKRIDATGRDSMVVENFEFTYRLPDASIG